jgi:hypothetical protein
VSVAGSSISFRVERTDRQTDTGVLFWLCCVVAAFQAHLGQKHHTQHYN